MSELELAGREAGAEPGLFGSAGCIGIDLRYQVTRDKFSVPHFVAFFDKSSEEDAKGMSVTLRTLDPHGLDYHMHFTWEFGKEFVTLYVSYHRGFLRPAEGEREPYAERFMPWLGAFFSNESAYADLHAEFRYSLEDRSSRFPLPLKTTVGDIEAEIMGISASLPSAPEGLVNMSVRLGKSSVVVDLRGGIRTSFADFDLKGEVSRLSAFAVRVTEARNAS